MTNKNHATFPKSRVSSAVQALINDPNPRRGVTLIEGETSLDDERSVTTCRN